MKALTLMAAGMISTGVAFGATGFVSVKGTGFVDEAGAKFEIRGVNLGHWLNPEGYMFRFGICNSPRFIDEMLRQLVGPEEADSFWREFTENYITADDLKVIAAHGLTVVRLPLHYKLFTDELYLGGRNRGFEFCDRVIAWCREYGLRVVLDLHDAAGGQTGDNIDDSYGWPWLYESERFQRELCELWGRIAARYRDEPTVLGYDIINEPLGWQVKDDSPVRQRYEGRHEAICKAALKAIRASGARQIVFFPGTKWNTEFHVFSDFECDANLAYQCHSYGTNTLNQIRGNFTPFRDRSGRPMWMGETGGGTDDWTAETVAALKSADIGYTFWSYKMPDFEDKPSNHAGFSAVIMPEGWSNVVAFAKGPRAGYGEMDQTLYDTVGTRERAKEILRAYLKAIRAENCRIHERYFELIK